MNGTVTEIFSRPQAIENFRQYLLLRTATVVECPSLSASSGYVHII